MSKKTRKRVWVFVYGLLLAGFITILIQSTFAGWYKNDSVAGSRSGSVGAIGPLAGVVLAHYKLEKEHTAKLMTTVPAKDEAAGQISLIYIEDSKRRRGNAYYGLRNNTNMSPNNGRGNSAMAVLDACVKGGHSISDEMDDAYMCKRLICRACASDMIRCTNACEFEYCNELCDLAFPVSL